jgi:hypothetical protein
MRVEAGRENGGWTDLDRSARAHVAPPPKKMPRAALLPTPPKAGSGSLGTGQEAMTD